MTEPRTPARADAGRWEDLAVGHVFAPIAYSVSAEAVEHFVDAIGEDHPWYHGESPFGFAVVPPALVMTDYTRFLAQVLPPITGMHARHQLRLIRPLPVGQRVTLEGEIVDKFIKRGHRYLVIDYRLVDEAGNRFMTNRITTTLAGYIVDGAVEAAG